MYDSDIEILPIHLYQAYNVRELIRTILSGDGAAERRLLSDFLKRSTHNFFQAFPTLEDTPPVKDESVELQEKDKQIMIRKIGLIFGVEILWIQEAMWYVS